MLPEATAAAARIEQQVVAGTLASRSGSPDAALRPLGPDAWRVALDAARSAGVSQAASRSAEMLRRAEALLEGEEACGRCWSQIAGEWLRLRQESRAAFALDRSVEAYEAEWRRDARSRVPAEDLLALDEGYRVANREPGPEAQAALEQIVRSSAEE
jgi:hypothetical protein